MEAEDSIATTFEQSLVSVRDATGTGDRPVRSGLEFPTGRSRNFLHLFMDFRSIFAKIKCRNTLFCMTEKFY